MANGMVPHVKLRKETKGLRDVLRSMRRGDRVCVLGDKILIGYEVSGEAASFLGVSCLLHSPSLMETIPGAEVSTGVIELGFGKSA